MTQDMQYDLRGEISTLASDDSDVNVVHLGNLGHKAAELEVKVRIEGIELLFEVELDDGDAATLFEEDWVGHVGCG
jgi:hypothetical protein